MQQVEIYSDGGADPNPGPGGWGVVLIHPESGKIRELSGGAEKTTNNRMELTAAIEALKTLTQPCEVEFYTDSTYLRKGVTEWLDGWVKSGRLREGSKNQVENVDLWLQLLELRDQHKIAWHWVKGHAGNKYNERADELATAGRPGSAEVIDQTVGQLYLRIAGPIKGANGACGWAAYLILPDGEESQFSGAHPQMSVNQFALYAILEALKQLPQDEPIQIFINNDYLFNGITKWVKGWRGGGWAKDIKFKDLWQRLDRENQSRRIQWRLEKNTAEMPEILEQLEKTAKEARDNR